MWKEKRPAANLRRLAKKKIPDMNTINISL